MEQGTGRPGPGGWLLAWGVGVGAGLLLLPELQTHLPRTPFSLCVLCSLRCDVEVCSLLFLSEELPPRLEKRHLRLMP